MNIFSKKSLFFSILLLILIVVTGLSVSAQEPIKIGVVQNLTGPWASIDGPSWNGVHLAVDELNEAGGVLERPIETVCIDTKADESEVVAAITRLIEREDSSIIIGYSDSHWVLTAAPIAREYGIPFITPGATHPRIPERTGAWLACFGDHDQASVMAEWAIKEEGLEKTAIWVDTAVDFSVAVCAFYADAFTHFGGEVVYEDSFETDWTDFSSMVARLKAQQDAGQIDSVYIGAIPGNAGLIAKQIREGGVTVPILSEDGVDTPLLVEVAGEYAEGVLFVSHVSLTDPDPLVQDFVKSYEEKFGNKPENGFAALGYDTMKLVAEAIEIAGSDDPAKIDESIGKVEDFQGVTGIINYEEGNKVPEKGVSVLVVEDGVFKTLTSMAPSYRPDPKIAD